MKYQTIDDLMDLFHPDYVSVDNPKMPGTVTPGNTFVRKFEVEYDEADGILLWVTIL